MWTYIFGALHKVIYNKVTYQYIQVATNVIVTGQKGLTNVTDAWYMYIQKLPSLPL